VFLRTLESVFRCFVVWFRGQRHNESPMAWQIALYRVQNKLSSNRLKTNADKTQIIRLSIRQQLAQGYCLRSLIFIGSFQRFFVHHELIGIDYHAACNILLHSITATSTAAGQ